MSTALRHPTSLTLRRFIHRVMDTARRVPVPAVEWDDIRGASYLAPAAMKVLGCMHLFASYEAKMEGRYPWYSGDAGMYEETMQVQVFRQYLAPLGREFFDKYSGLEPASLVNRLSADDMTRFRDCLGKAWQELQELSSVIPSNKRLYDEMFKTRRSLEDYFQHFVLEHQDHMTETELARKLGVSRKCLWERRQRLGIPRRKASASSDAS